MQVRPFVTFGRRSAANRLARGLGFRGGGGPRLLDPGKERRHLRALPGGHVLEVAAAVDDLPEVLRLYALQLLADRAQAVGSLRPHVVGDAPRAVGLAGVEVVAGEL